MFRDTGTVTFKLIEGAKLPFTQVDLISRRKGERDMKATGIVRRVDE